MVCVPCIVVPILLVAWYALQSLFGVVMGKLGFQRPQQPEAAKDKAEPPAIVKATAASKLQTASPSLSDSELRSRKAAECLIKTPAA